MRLITAARIVLCFGLAVLGSGVSQGAVGTVDMTWDGCTGPVDKTSAVAGPIELFVTVTGHDAPHKAYEVRILYGNPWYVVPDAWRFDADGCQTLERIQQEVTSNLCSSFHQNAAGALQIKKVQISSPQDPVPQTLMHVLLANSYPPVITVDSATRYLLERIRFDLTDAVAGAGSPPATCGGIEGTMYFELISATWLDLNGIEVQFNRSNQPLIVTFNAQVPARATTWGSIKSQYRN